MPRIENQVLDDPTFCEICHQSDREDRMLLCDGCDRGYHMECLTPPITTVPIEEWYCPECTQRNSTRTVTILILIRISEDVIFISCAGNVYLTNLAYKLNINSVM